MIGSTLGGYRIVEQIGMGGMATVYKAYDAGTDRYVAVKVLPKHYSQDPTFRERFRREAKAIAKLEHPYIVPVHAYGEDEAEGIAYLVMRYLETGTLADRLLKGRLALDEAGRLLRQISDALDYAHKSRILHRDVKPSNVLVDAQGNAYLTDFGIAKMVEGVSDLTGTGLALGTPQYMSPEQCYGVKDLTPATDVYSLGVVLYQMVTGRVPFEAETPLAVIHMQLNDPLPPPRSIRADLPEGVEKVILKAMAKEPDQRFASCGDMAAAYEKALAEAADTAHPARTPSEALPAAPREVPTPPLFEAPPEARRGLPGWVVPIGALVVVLACALGVVAVALGVLGGAATAGGGGTGQDTPAPPTERVAVQAPTPRETPAPPTSEPAPPTVVGAITGGVASGGVCDGRSTPIEVNVPYSGHIDATDQGYPSNCAYYCLYVPDDLTRFQIGISGFDVDLDMYVGYGAIESVLGADPSEAGWLSNALGTDDESVTIEDPESEAAYYIEVCSFEGLAADYQLVASTP